MNDRSPPADARAQAIRLLRLAAAAGVLLAALAMLLFHLTGTPLRLHFVIAVSSGIILVMTLAGGLMALGFLSSRTGHDDVAGQPDELGPEERQGTRARE
ncbi:MAG: hypothetical protein SNJ63_07945 [Sphingomonadaceae bacterium]